MLKFWQHLINKYEHTTEGEQVLPYLSNLLAFASCLNEEYVLLVLKSTNHTNSYFQLDKLAEHLSYLMTLGEAKQTATYIGQILSSITAPRHTNSKRFLLDIVTFLYENGQKTAADDFCNKMTKQGHEFLIDLYNRYNSNQR